MYKIIVDQKFFEDAGIDLTKEYHECEECKCPNHHTLGCEGCDPGVELNCDCNDLGNLILFEELPLPFVMALVMRKGSFIHRLEAEKLNGGGHIYVTQCKLCNCSGSRIQVNKPTS